MKIGIMGTHGAGKTTLANRLLRRYLDDDGDAVLIDESARHCPFPVNKQMTLASQQWILAEQIAVEHKFHGYTGVLVCDRTVIDPVIYAMWAEQAAPGPMPEMAAWIKAVLPFVVHWAGSYDRLYWCRCGSPPPSDDGFRDTDPAFAEQVDGLFEQVVTATNLDVIHAPGGLI